MRKSTAAATQTGTNDRAMAHHFGRGTLVIAGKYGESRPKSASEQEGSSFLRLRSIARIEVKSRMRLP